MPDLPGLGARWRALEQRVPCSFFQSWSWVGCLAAERYRDPVLLVAASGGQDVGLALFERGRSRLSPRTLWLHESGRPAFDTIYIEHNGVLLAPEHAGSLAACLSTALPRGLSGRLVLSGCDNAHLAAARAAGMVQLTETQPAPYADLGTDLGTGGPGGLDSLSAGTRYQLRRSIRRYETHGALQVQRAASLAEAWDVLADLSRLHQASWTARGKPGAFASPFFRRFHARLIEDCFPRGEIELLRISAGDHLIGCLYHFRHAGRVLSYQSGFADRGIHPHDKPGLVCHHLAIERARAEGLARYDFLAGSNRTKTALANGSADLHWFGLVRPWSPRGVIGRMGWRRAPSYSPPP